MAQAGEHAAEGCSRLRVVLLGHSYMSRFHDYMSTDEKLSNLGFPETVEVSCIGVGEATLGPQRNPNIDEHLTEVSRLQPDVIYLHTGENDLGHMSEDQIVCELLRLIQELSSLSRSHAVIVGQLVYFPQIRPQHPDSVLRINDALRHQIQPPAIFWRHRFGFLHGSDYFLSDGVHLSDRGLHRYWKSVRTAVGRALRHSHPSFRS